MGALNRWKRSDQPRWRCKQQALKQWQKTEGILNPDDMTRLLPSLLGHANRLICYDFTLHKAIAAEQLRLLRTLPNREVSLNELAWRYFLFLL